MAAFTLYERVQDKQDGRIGTIIKVKFENQQLIFRVKFAHTTEDYEASWLKKVL